MQKDRKIGTLIDSGLNALLEINSDEIVHKNFLMAILYLYVNQMLLKSFVYNYIWEWKRCFRFLLDEQKFSFRLVVEYDSWIATEGQKLKYGLMRPDAFGYRKELENGHAVMKRNSYEEVISYLNQFELPDGMEKNIKNLWREINGDGSKWLDVCGCFWIKRRFPWMKNGLRCIFGYGSLLFFWILVCWNGYIMISSMRF